MADLAKLTVRLEAESSKLRTELEKSNRQLDGFKKRVQKTVDRVKTLFAGLVVGGGIVALTKNFADQADQLAKLSTRLGSSVEDLSRLQHAADLSGVAFNQLTTGLQRMTRRISEAAKTGKGEAVPALQALGLSAKALQKLAPDKQFELLADAFAEVDNQSDKVRLAMKLFDSEGVALLQTMEGGAAAIRNMGAESDALGKTISTDTAKAAEKFNDSLTKLKASAFGFAQELFKNTGPQLTDIANFLSKELPGAVRIAALSFQTLLIGFKTIKTAAQGFVSALQKDIGDKLQALGQTDLAQSFFNVSKDSAAAAKQGFEELSNQIDKFKKNLFDGKDALKANKTELENVVVNLDDYRGKTETATDKNKALAASTRAVADAEKARQDILKRGQQLTEQLRTDAEKFIQIDNELADLLARNAISQETYNRALADAQSQYTVIGQVEEARLNVLDALKTKQDEYNEILKETQLALDAGVISTEQFDARMAQAMENLKEKTDDTKNALVDVEKFADQAARNIQDSFADFLFDPFSDGLKGMLGNLADTLRRMAAEILANAALKAALNYLSSLGGGGTQGGIAGTVGSLAGAALGALGGGAAADGARVKAGQPFLVGERGPELFIPNTQGVIEPNGAGMGSVTHVNVTVNGIRDEGGLRATANQIAGQAGSAVQRANQRNG